LLSVLNTGILCAFWYSIVFGFKEKSAAILKAGDAVTVVGHAVGIAHGLPPCRIAKT